MELVFKYHNIGFAIILDYFSKRKKKILFSSVTLNAVILKALWLTFLCDYDSYKGWAGPWRGKWE